MVDVHKFRILRHPEFTGKFLPGTFLPGTVGNGGVFLACGVNGIDMNSVNSHFDLVIRGSIKQP